ncbi:protein kinase [Candidatus Obscuribacterales bacterium]|nr:protein kinase [Candidatus Obscuribacterales bacterium]MBX3151438.1 protein kinase [Candidatus Obscuribacterales bacterium]
MTQWLSTCACQLQQPVDEKQQTVDFCIKCGKRIREGRLGSFTQFIFRYDLCPCDIPQGFKKPEFSDSQPAVAALDSSNEVEESELDVDPNKFPLDRYSPLRVVGRGSAGTVYLCRDRLLRKRVTVKTLHVQSREQLVLFQNEARVLSKLDHPNIVQILDFGATTGGSPYMVLEYSAGRSLDAHLQDEGPLDWKTAAFMFASLCAALEYCHIQGVFHRDLKPSNILMITNGDQSTVKLFDFGVAEIQSVGSEDQHVTIVGTPSYMAPDQALGREFDARSEIYSLGCVIFETLTGVAPFVGGTALELLSKHAHDEPPLLSDLVSSEIPEQFQSVISKCMEKNPDDRYSSMREVRLELLSIAADAQSAESTSFPEEIRGPSSLVPALLGILAVFVVCGATMVFWNALEGRLSEQSLPSKTRLYDRADEAIPVLSSRMFAANGRLEAQPDFEDDDMHVVAQFAGSAQTQLSLAGSRVTGKYLSHLLKIKMLNDLDLSNTVIGDAECASVVGKLTQLRQLKLNSTSITDDGIKHLSRLRNLESLSIGKTRVTDSGLDALCKLPRLKELSVDECPGLTIAGIEKIIKIPTLTILSAAGCPNVSDQDLAKIAKEKPTCFVKTSAYHKAELASEREKLLPQVLKRYLKDMRDPGFRKFFMRKDCFNTRTSFDDIKDPRILACLKDPQLRDCMLEPSCLKVWHNPKTWSNLENMEKSANQELDKLLKKVYKTPGNAP